MTTPDPGQPTQSASHPPRSGPLHRWVLPIRPPKPVNPALVETCRAARGGTSRTGSRTGSPRFAGSMAFVYLHILWFGCWIAFGLEDPFGLLTMIVSLEAIFLSTFVMISQNRADAKRQVVADQAWRMVQEEDEQNKQLLELSRQILALTTEVRAFAGLAKENHDQNEQLLDLSRQALALTKEVHAAGNG